MRIPLASLVRWGLSLALLAVLAQQLAARWDALRAQAFAFDARFAALSLVAAALYFAGCSLAWQRLLAALGGSLGFREAFHTIYYANVAKYLPGSVWNLVGRVVLCQRRGVPALVASAALLMDSVCQVVAGVLVGLLALPAFAAGEAFGGRAVVAPVAALLALIVAAMHPRVLNAGLASGERLFSRLGRPRELPRVPYRYGFVLAMLALYTWNWAVLGTGFALLGRALSPTPLDPSQWLLLVGGFTIAWNVGVFALFAPAGLGVREAAIAMLLAGAFPAGWPALLALAARVWIVACEGAAFGVAALWAGEAKAAEPPAAAPVG
jgi:hypothetical protein